MSTSSTQSKSDSGSVPVVALDRNLPPTNELKRFLSLFVDLVVTYRHRKQIDIKKILALAQTYVSHEDESIHMLTARLLAECAKIVPLQVDPSIMDDMDDMNDMDEDVMPTHSSKAINAEQGEDPCTVSPLAKQVGQMSLDSDSRSDDHLTLQVGQLDKIVKRVIFQPVIQVYSSFHANASFVAPICRNLGELFQHTFKEFKIDRSAFHKPRFYWLPSGDLTTQQRIDQRKTFTHTKADSEKWNSFLDEKIELGIDGMIELTFVAGEESPTIFPQAQPVNLPKPRRLALVDGEEVRSEPESVDGLVERDGSVCFICGRANPLVAHVVDKSREELLDVTDAPAVDDVRNCLQLCPNHHQSFDQLKWTLVEAKHVASWLPANNKAGSTSYYVRRCAKSLPRSGPDDISPYMSKAYHFSNPACAPPSYLFLLKQFGRFKVPCRCCAQLWDPIDLPEHYTLAHQSEEEQQVWKNQPHLLPRPCRCPDRGTTVWELYCHVFEKHRELLFV